MAVASSLSFSSSSLRLFSPLLKPSSSSSFSLSLSKPSSAWIPFSSPISFQPLSPNPKPSPIRSHLHHSTPPSSSLDTSLLPSKLRHIVALFQSVPDSKAKYQQLLHYASKLPPLDPAHKSDSNRVSGCVSRVWVRAFKDGCGGGGGGGICFEADSDSALTKGLAALLVLGLSGSPARDIARVPPEFVELLGIRQSLTPSRNSGFLNMLRLMQRKALELEALDGGGGGGGGVGGGGVGGSGDSAEDKNVILDERPGKVGEIAVNGHANYEKGERLYGLEGAEEDDGKVGVDVEVNSTSSSSVTGGRKERIRERLEKELSPVELDIDDISHLHAGHAGVAGSSGGETHFNVRVVSKAFEGKSLLKRHRLVYDLLKDELSSGLHALSIDAKTPSEV